MSWAFVDVQVKFHVHNIVSPAYVVKAEGIIIEHICVNLYIKLYGTIEAKTTELMCLSCALLKKITS